MTADSWEKPPASRRGRWALGLALAAGVVALGTLARPGPGSGPDLPIERAPASTAGAGAAGSPTPSASPSPPVSPPPQAGGEWVDRGAAPIEAPPSHDGVWTGAELVVGFQPQVAAYDPATGVWRRLPPVPGPLRVAPEVVRTGRHVLVLGGLEPDPAASLRRDGHLLDLDAGRWRPVAPVPASAAPLWDPVAVWTGDEVIVWGGARPGDAHELGQWPVRGAAYRPGEDRWRAVARAPVANVYLSAGLWTGREVVVWGTHHPPDQLPGTEAGPAYAAAYDPATDTWRRLPGPPLDNPAGAAAVWTGREIVLWGRPPWRPQRDLPGVLGAALDPSATEEGWRLLADVATGDGSGTSLDGIAAAWTGQRALFYGGAPRSVGLAHDPDAGTWLRLPPHRARLDPVAAWTGTELLLWGGFTSTGPAVDLWSFRPAGGGAVAPGP